MKKDKFYTKKRKELIEQAKNFKVWDDMYIINLLKPALEMMNYYYNEEGAKDNFVCDAIMDDAFKALSRCVNICNQLNSFILINSYAQFHNITYGQRELMLKKELYRLLKRYSHFWWD